MKEEMEESSDVIKINSLLVVENENLTRWSSMGSMQGTSDSEQELRTFDGSRNSDELNKIESLEIEQEKLTNSLLALTSHFAQVQFRLKQIIKSPSEEWTDLLGNLEEFAFQGIPEIPDCSNEKAPKLSIDEGQREKQIDMIDQLKTQLEDLEKYAFEAGDLVLPQTILFEKQKIIIDELKKKINLPFDQKKMAHLSTDELKNHIDSAMGELTNPIKMKDHLVNQLKTQINDLERFINFIQYEEIPENFLAKTASCDCSETHNQKKVLLRKNSKNKLESRELTLLDNGRREEPTDGGRRATGQFFLPSIYTFFEMFTSLHMGNSPGNHFRRNVLKKTARGNHWGDIRAQLELDVEEVIKHLNHMNSSMSFDTADRHRNNTILVNLVRKRMAVSLRNLLHHGMTRVSRNHNTSSSLVPFISCFAMPKNTEDDHYEENNYYGDSNPQMHIWDLILEYYYSQNGDKYNQTPAVRLSQSFNLDLVDDSSTVSAKKSLLSNIGNTISIHSIHKSSSNAQFKSLVCAGLNSKRLGKWIKLIVENKGMVRAFYEPWSYTVQTGFRDGLRTLEKLTSLKFQLPIDTAVRQFENINDIFL